MLIIPSLFSCLIGGVIGFQVFMFKSINALKVDINKLELELAKNHLTKDEMRDLLHDTEKRINLNINNQLDAIRRREVRK